MVVLTTADLRLTYVETGARELEPLGKTLRDHIIVKAIYDFL